MTAIHYGDPEGFRRLISDTTAIIERNSPLAAMVSSAEQIITHYRTHGYTDMEIGAVLAMSLVATIRKTQPDIDPATVMVVAVILIGKAEL